MSASKRYFYVVNVPAGEARTCLDTIRLIARPQTRFPAHITIRGPYDQPSETTSHLSERIRGKIVRVGDVGRFEGKQKVVFLHCSCPDFLAIWDKPEFGYTPHLTLYEGASEEFADALSDILESHPVKVIFRAAGLDLLVSDQEAGRSVIREQYDPAAIVGVLGEILSLEQLDAMASSQRLDRIERIVRHLAKAQRAAIPPLLGSGIASHGIGPDEPPAGLPGGAPAALG